MGKKNIILTGMTIAITTMLLINAIVLVLNQQVSATHFHEYPTGSDFIGDDFGYATTITASGLHGGPSPTSDIDNSRRLADNIAPNIYVDSDSVPNGFAPTDFINIMNNAIDDWDDSVIQYTEMATWTVVDDDDSTASLFNECTENEGPNDRFEVAFCDIGAAGEVILWPNADVMAMNGGLDFYTEADMVLDSGRDWGETTAFMEEVATHEFGHVFGLGDMYNIHGGTSGQCDFSEFINGPPVMCSGQSENVEIGDINGIYYLYPDTEDLPFPEVYHVAEETDIAIAQLSGSANTNPEFVVVEVDEDLTSSDIQHFMVRPYLDMNPNTYEGTHGVKEELTDTGFPILVGDIDEVGLSLVNITQDTKPEMIISWIESSNIGYWRVYWDVDLSSGNLDWDGVSSIHQMPSLLSATNGMDTVFMDMDDDGELDMVVIKSRTDGSEYFVYYSYVELDENTGAASGSWTHVNNPSVTIEIEDERIGAAIIDDADRIVAITYNADALFDEYAGYRVVRFNEGGTVDEVNERRQLMPLEPTPTQSDVDGLGADAYDWAGVGAPGDEYKDLVVMWMDSGITSFAVDRDSKYNAHGDTDISVPGGVLIDAEDCSGNVISGMSVSLYDSVGNLLQNGFTPMYHDITTDGTYLVKYNNFGGNTYVTAETQPVPVTDSRQFTTWGGEADLSLSASIPYRVVGVYTTSGTTCPSGTGSITIRAEREDTGAQIDGLYVQLQNSAHTEIDNGFTTKTFSNLNAGTYYVYPNDFAPYYFSHWEDTGSASREREVILGGGQTPTYTAVYDYVP